MIRVPLNRLYLWLLLILTGFWLLFVLYLDLKYDRFPDVLLGGAKILLFLYLVIFLIWLLGRGARWVAIQMRRRT